jgi:7-dehydrocholesterol reductase
MWGNKISEAKGMLPYRDTLGPLFLLTATPITLQLLAYTTMDEEVNGSFLKLGEQFMELGFFGVLYRAFVVPTQDCDRMWKAAQILAVYGAFQAAVMRLMPGKTYIGPVSPSGHRPVYKANGLQAFFFSVAAFLVFSDAVESTPTFFGADIVYRYMMEMVTVTQGAAMLFCLFLTLKGLYFPSGPDSGTTGNVLMDYYWGTELYPRVFGWDVKLFTNCRWGMVAWVIMPLSYAAAQHKMTGSITPAMAVSVVLQIIYTCKFFWWETGYLATMDIQHDRAGFYICYGCLIFLPVLYTAHTRWLVDPPVPHPLTTTGAIIVGLIGFAAIFINYDADRQRGFVRATDGQGLLWGRKPRIIRAKYQTEGGETKNSILLVDGWWAVSRHFHYVPELTAALCWCVPGTTYVYPYVYFLFLTVLLVDRAFRDDQRCADKYGKYYAKYCELVPYKLIPGLL